MRRTLVPVLVLLALIGLLARAGSYPPDVKYTDSLYRPAAREARSTGLSMWR